MADASDPLEPGQPEIEVEPTIAGRLARWTERARLLRTQVDAARADHESVDFGFGLIERDSALGGGLLAGALAYRLFVFLLPTALLLVSGLGLYAGSIDKSPSKVAEDAGLHGLIASEVASAASGRHRGLVFLLMVPAVFYAMVTLYRAIAKVHAIAWYGSGRGIRTTRRGVGVFAAALLLQFVAVEILGWTRRADRLGGLAALLVYLVLASGAWLATAPPRGALVRRRVGVRERFQHLCDDSPRREPRQHLRCARDRHSPPFLAGARRAADGRIRRAQRIAGRTPHTKPDHRFLGSDRTPCRHPTKTRRASGAGPMPASAIGAHVPGSGSQHCPCSSCRSYSAASSSLE